MQRGIQYVQGDVTHPLGEGAKLIVQCCNDAGRYGAGVSRAIGRRLPVVERRYRAWARGIVCGPFALGSMQVIDVAPNLAVVNIIGQRGIRSATNPRPIDYQALECGLNRVWTIARDRGATVHMPRIGCGLAGGTWEQVEPIVRATLVVRHIGVTVYDLRL